MRMESRRQQGQIAQVQSVRFVKPRTRIKTIATYCIVGYVCWNVYSRVILDPLDRAVVETLDSLPEEEDEEEEKPFFIPFPGTTRQLKPVPYKGSDPEWQEFIKFSKDQKLAQKVREELADFVQQVASKHPLLKIRCGTGFKLRRFWLDVDFPQHAPPQFERSGIEISDEYIAIAKQPVDSLVVFRIRQALWPTALFQSTWSFLKVMVNDDAKYIAQKLGFKPTKPPPSIEQIVTKHQQMFKGPPQLPTKDGPSPTTQPPVLGDGAQTITSPPGRGDKSPLAGQKPEEVDIGSAGMALHAHFFRPIMAFKAKLAQTWRPAPNFPPRGSILISGLVELDTPKAWLVFDVKAAWDPKTRTYDPRSMHVQLRRMQLKKQGPVGGR
ncbi:uncharacterized protein LY89DRAFT_599142 [Mollisia scopiformis]|uniref:Uncharacterized protein n=1 Tax=Mollisia scopiformis TaxID=149040 RepID=A0A132B916_MOLSC|nr:uncharacterized protein LY89DRAFT_599142 [Mollisia scopiformis]KUJ08902.1 hypothetical protein LY89DRAFT_599142 [Mollisia scopiformis]